MKEYCIITFESVNFAMQAESVLKNENIYHQVIPTPREITLSCGLSIRFNVDNVENIKTFVDNKRINIKNMYIVRGSGSDKKIEALK
ncbi:Protein of unknown function [Caloramator quimbayensis]|uniref:Putative Se/S carrier protein-like domain-containing protein n=1 Tax=Caloramator quimbayensis TaxID=1147123 RepID=A0A1T4Y6Z1_9CLOT|nr:DUF3343 domain-containing protein [Caloramator quimbayensis]SKA97500.1 Protein of unknown function [Caloramator quimbayensis]